MMYRAKTADATEEASKQEAPAEAKAAPETTQQPKEPK